MSAACSSCGAEIVWAVHQGSGKRMPVDAAPAENGNVRLMRRFTPEGKYVETVATVHGPDARAALRAQGVALHLNHFVTCPDREQHRRA